MEPLKSFFKPRSVAVIGASQNPDKLGYGVARNLIGCGYPGKIFLINPKGGKLFEKKIFTSINEIEEPVDLGLIVVPSKFVPDLLIEANRKGIKNFIILSGGFSESGEEGARIEEACKQIALQENLRIIGPNCIGILDTHFPLDTTFIQPPLPDPGEIAFITHSGALGAAMIDWARGEGFGFSQVISLGNQIDVDESDVILPAAKSPQNAVVTIYLEGVKDGRKFINQAEQAVELKPVLALKVGRSPAGKKAVSSHTGALAGEDASYSAAFRKAGILRVEKTEEMFTKAKTLAWSAMPGGNRVAVLTNAGGPGVIATDAVSHHGLIMASLGQGTTKSLRRLLPDAASVRNPVDMLASAAPKIYSKCLEVLLDDPGVDMVLAIVPPPPMFEAIDVAKEIAGVIKRYSKPVVISFMGSGLVEEAVKFCRLEKIPEYTFPEDGISALAALWQRVQYKKRDKSKLGSATPMSVISDANQILDKINQKSKGGYLPTEEGMEIARLYGLPGVDTIFASSSAEAAQAAEKLGYPVVMKIAVEEISHKSDRGGILMNLESREEVIHGYENLNEKFAVHIKGEQSFAVQIQKMIGAGQEVIVGAVRDPVFGPLVMFGSGGIEVEGLKDIQFSIAPMTRADMEYMMANTWAGKKLQGYRHLQKADIQIVQETLVSLGQILIDCPGIKEIEINPLIVLGEGQGAHAVDIRMIGYW